MSHGPKLATNLESHQSPFFQEQGRLGNTFANDRYLQKLLKYFIPSEIYSEVAKHLDAVGAAAAGELLQWADECEQDPPQHIAFSAWGRRIDELRLHPSWKKIEDFSATHGIVASGYERKQAEFSRIYQAALLYLFHPSSSFVSCPLAMTDGAAKLLELHGDEFLKAKAFKNLTSREPAKFWTSGQWMTEKIGGSDVSQTETIARAQADGEMTHQLFGTKWFTSSTASPMALALARIEGAPAGNKGLSLFYLEVRRPDGALNGITIHRLKNKLGTKALPTAELSLQGSLARLVGEAGQGVKTITSLINVTRLYNSVCAVAHMQRAIVLAEDYSKNRVAFGKPVAEQPLHQETFRIAESERVGYLLFCFKVCELLGKEETSKASPEEKRLLRLVIPLLKLSSAKSCMQTTSEMVEAFGGMGYIEDTGIPRLLRDAQVFSIWEGTTNVLSLDVLRVLSKEIEFSEFTALIDQAISSCAAQTDISASLTRQQSRIKELHRLCNEGQLQHLRNLSLSMARLYVACLLVAWFKETKDTEVQALTRRWLEV